MVDHEKQQRINTYEALRALGTDEVEVLTLDVVTDVDGLPLAVDGELSTATLALDPELLGLTLDEVENHE